MFTLGAFTSHEIMIIFYCVKMFGLENLKKVYERAIFQKGAIQQESLLIPKSSRVMLTLRGGCRV